MRWTLVIHHKYCHLVLTLHPLLIIQTIFIPWNSERHILQNIDPAFHLHNQNKWWSGMSSSTNANKKYHKDFLKVVHTL